MLLSDIYVCVFVEIYMRLTDLGCFSDAKYKLISRSACEWHYDACASPCFKTCRDPLGQNCQAVPK